MFIGEKKTSLCAVGAADDGVKKGEEGAGGDLGA